MDDDWTRDEPLPGLSIWQPRAGFRYGADAFWLAGFALEGGRPKKAVDLGTGSGIVAVLLAAHGAVVDGYDDRGEWTWGWHRTLGQDTPVARRLSLCRLDVRQVVATDADLAVCNPPYFPRGAGPSSPDLWKAAARTEGDATLADFVAAAARVAPRLCFVVPTGRESEASCEGFTPTRITRVGRKRVLVELTKGRHEVRVEEIDEGAAARFYRVVHSVPEDA